MIFSRKIVLPSPPWLKILDKESPKVFLSKFLGILMDPKLSGKPQLTHLVRKGFTLTNILLSLSGTWWDLHLHLLLTLYRAIFRGSIESVAKCFDISEIKRSGPNSRDFKIVRSELLWNIAYLRLSMFYEAREVPLKIRFNYLTKKFLIKKFSRKHNHVISSLDLNGFSNL